MNAVKVLRTRREISCARASAAASLSSASLETIVAASGDRLDVSFSSLRSRPIALEREADACRAMTLELLPEALRGQLAVEAGEVRSLFQDGGREVRLFSRNYRMAICRGMVLGLRDDDAGSPFRSPWTGTLEPEELGSSLPIVLAPSAVLALISFALEVTGSHMTAESSAEMREITVLDTASSPYPPQHHPFEADGTVAPDRPLIEDGRWCNRQEHAGDDVDPLFFLLTRPERALRPLAAATHFNHRNLVVACSRKMAVPAAAVVVDSWRVRVGPRGGAVPFHATLSRIGSEGDRLAVTSPVPLLLDPWQVLTHIQGASGPMAPALDQDPIEGDGYGEAPPLVTALTLADLAAPEKPR
jgi:hypothetical protein